MKIRQVLKASKMSCDIQIPQYYLVLLLSAG